MKYGKDRRHTVDFVFVLTLFFIFAMSSLAVVYIGSSVYSSIATAMDDKFNRNVAMDYMLEKIRQTDAKGCIQIEDFGNVEALCLKEEYRGRTYITYIYEDGGRLKELFISGEEPFAPEKGEAVMELEALSFEADGSLLVIDITAGGQTMRAYADIIGGDEFETR